MGGTKAHLCSNQANVTKNYQKLIKPLATSATNKLKTSGKILLAPPQPISPKTEQSNRPIPLLCLLPFIPKG
jgi:hypothetical protein